jgi:trigger factor
METTLTEVSPVEYELEVTASADELKDRVKAAVRTQRSKMDIKGFRKGKVPAQMVKKMSGPALSMRIAEQVTQDAFEEALNERDDIEMMGRPQISEIDYEIDSDLRTVLRFGIRPDVELADLSNEEVRMLVHEVSDEDVEEEIENIREQEADLVPVDEPAGDGDYVSVDLQRIDTATDTPIIGEGDEDVTFFLDDERLREELRDAIMGTEAGDTVRATLPPPPHSEEGEARTFDITVNDVKRRDLPPFDAELVRRFTDGTMDDPEAFRDELRSRIAQSYEQQSREMVQGEIVDRMLELHTVPVPPSVVESFLDSFEEELAEEEYDGDLPDDFDHTHFREQNRGDAERQARWMIIRDKVIDDADLEVTDDDLRDFFSDQMQGQEDISVEQIRGFYQSMPRMMEQVDQQVLSRKVYDELIDRFDVRELDLETFRQEIQAEHAAAHGHEHHDHDHDHDHDHGPAEEDDAPSSIIT